MVRKRLTARRPTSEIWEEIRRVQDDQSATYKAISEEEKRVKEELAASPGWDQLMWYERSKIERETLRSESAETGLVAQRIENERRIRALYQELRVHPDTADSIQITLTQAELLKLHDFTKGQEYDYKALAAAIVRNWLKGHSLT